MTERKNEMSSDMLAPPFCCQNGTTTVVLYNKKRKNDMKRILINKIRCKHCGDIIESKSVHDYKQCSCGAVSVDGGLDYIRRTFLSIQEDDYDELSVFEDSNLKCSDCAKFNNDIACAGCEPNDNVVRNGKLCAGYVSKLCL